MIQGMKAPMISIKRLLFRLMKISRFPVTSNPDRKTVKYIESSVWLRVNLKIQRKGRKYLKPMKENWRS